MRLNEFSYPDREKTKKLETIKDFILKNCKPYLRDINNDPVTYVLYRGVISDYREVKKSDGGMKGYYRTKVKSAMVVSPRAHRQPKDTSRRIHQIITAAFANAGFVANRDNSIFATGNKNEAAGYGSYVGTYPKEISTTYAVYPMGNYDYTWSPEVKDFTNIFGDTSAFFRHTTTIENLDKVMIKTELILMEILKSVGVFNWQCSQCDFEEFMEDNVKIAQRFEAGSLTLEFLFRYLVSDLHYKYENLISKFIEPYEDFNELKAEFPEITQGEPNYDFITSKYRTDNIKAAINSKSEVMIKADKIFLVRHDFDDMIWGRDL